MQYDKDNIFAKILHREMPANIVFENDHVMAFEDVKPQAPHHYLIIPKVEIPSVNEFEEEHKQIIGEMVLAAKAVARELGIDQKGYRLVFNTYDDGGQEIYHVHLHLLGGRRMKWPPG